MGETLKQYVHSLFISKQIVFSKFKYRVYYYRIKTHYSFTCIEVSVLLPSHVHLWKDCR